MGIRSARADVAPRKPWLMAIGRALAAQYTLAREPVPERLAALLKKLALQRKMAPSGCPGPWSWKIRKVR